MDYCIILIIVSVLKMCRRILNIHRHKCFRYACIVAKMAYLHLYDHLLFLGYERNEPNRRALVMKSKLKIGSNDF